MTEPISVRFPEELLSEIDEQMEEMVEAGALPPNVNRSDALRMAALLWLEESEDNEELEELAREYFRK